MDNLRIPPSELLYRIGYISPEKKFMNPDGTATSRVFKLREKDNGKLSVDVKSLTSAMIAIKNPNEYMLFEVLVFNIETLGLSSYYDPKEDNAAHAYIFGMDLDDDITPGLLARKAKRIYI